jgi:phosphoglycerol transferase MdoB-like AlkP superfamily enzyme
MKSRIIILLKTYFLFILIFIAWQPIFMVYHHAIYRTATFSDYLLVIYHGFPLDFSVAGYLTVIPALLLIVSVFCRFSVYQRMAHIYYVIISIFLSFVYITDMVLYSFWGFRLDSTPIYYFFTSPKDAFASVSIWFILLGFVAYIGVAVLLFYLFHRVLVERRQPLVPIRSYKTAGILILCTAFLFLPIRGGVTTSVVNVGKAYFSSQQSLNHAAINPCFSFLNSFFHEMNTRQYHYFKNEDANRLFAQMTDTTSAAPDQIQIFTTPRPNVIVVILESFSAQIMQTMGGTPHVAVNMDQFTSEGVFFTRFAANSFRTDRGVASILAGYPAQPTTSIMKYPDKSQSLPMFPRVMKDAGYELKYYYGGDIDFTNMRSFVITAGFDRIVRDADFPLKDRLSKWGVPDGPVFQRAYNDIRQEKSSKPFLKIVQTSSSHEPFDVPNFHRLNDKVLNAFAYADSCLGDFVHQLKALPMWKNTVVILVPDHLGCYPSGIDNYSFERYHIPLIMIGGAIRQPMQVSTFGSQIDIAATLLSQLHLSHKAFTFSKDMFNARSPHFCFSTFPNAFCMMTPEDSVFFNCESNKVIVEKGKHKGKNLPYGKVYLQKLYEDLDKR